MIVWKPKPFVNEVLDGDPTLVAMSDECGLKI
jgi:hypothetical protein